jgi:hypothetical protein
MAIPGSNGRLERLSDVLCKYADINDETPRKSRFAVKPRPPLVSTQIILYQISMQMYIMQIMDPMCIE